MIVGVVGLHVWALHVVGQNNPAGVDIKDVKRDSVPFTPYATMKDGYALTVFLLLYCWFIFYVPNYLGHSDNYIDANPLVTPAHIVPEWYFLPFYAILRAIPSKLGGVLAMFGSIAILAFLPWLDTSRVRSGVFRPVFKVLFWVFVLVCIGLGYLGAMPAEGGYVIASRLLTALYFLFFLSLPFIGWFEKTKPVPATIADAVLGKGAGPVALAGAAHEKP